jgi:hypothetical protein
MAAICGQFPATSPDGMDCRRLARLVAMGSATLTGLIGLIAVALALFT